MANACPICAGMGGASGGEAKSAAEKFEGLIKSLGGTSSAASALEGVLQKLGAAEGAAAAAAKLAAQTGYKAADVRRAMAAQAKEAADATKALAAAQEAAAKADAAAAKVAAKEAAALAKEHAAAMAAQAKEAVKAAETGAKAAEASTKSALAERKESAKSAVEAFLIRQKKAEAAKEQRRHAAETAEDFKKLTATGNRTNETIAALKENYGLAAQGAGLMAAGVVLVVGALSALMAKAIEASGAADRLRASWGAYFGTGAAGFLGELDAIAAKLPYTAAKIRDMAGPLIDARLRGAQLARAIEAVAAATAIMGDKGGAAATTLIKQLAAGARLNQAVWISPEMLEQLSAAGISAEVLAKELGVSEKRLQLSTVKASVLGDVLQRVLIKNGAGSLALIGQTWDSITGKIQEGLTAAFAGLGDIVGPFMKEVQYLASELFKGSVASKGMGGVLRAVLEPAFKLATAGVRALHYALLYVEIAALTVYIALRPLGQWLEKIGLVSFLASWGLLALKWVAIGLAVIFGLLAVAVTLAFLPFIVATAAIILLVFGLYKLGSAIVGAADVVAAGAASIQASIGEALDGATSKLANWPLEAAKAGLNFVMGLIQAITTGSGPVADAVKGLASSAVSALFGALQIRSPSRITAKAGGHFVEGFAGAVDEGQGDAKAAGSGLGDAAAGGLAKSAQGGGKGVAGRVINFINCTFGAGMSETVVRDMVSRILEAEASSGPEPEPA